MSRLSPIPRRGSRSSMRSNTTYHSFQEVELSEPSMSSKTSAVTSAISTPQLKEEFEATPMRRHDSGYESLPPRSSRRRTSTTSSAHSNSSARPRTRPAVRRSPQSGPVSHMPRSNNAQQLFRTRSHTSAYTQHQLSQSPATYYYFPAMPDPAEETDDVSQQQQQPQRHQAYSVPTSLDYGARPIPPYSSELPDTPTSPVYPVLPPQTTHYWTSDRTRRLEYAAIDAASRGVRGWVMRHLVPDCFIPKSKKGQHLGFDDDGGSVRRYRLDLDEDDVMCPRGAEKSSPRKQNRWRPWAAASM